ncbi:hypothetical protein EZ313_16945 [Ramlibacter henchirensis]|uniref:Cupin domain-containing protein n=1 Tax=Ramlibacter henchirensis TaxID=204072 RepID=A0A4Z0BVL3_9BURK|nr:hypothetical protein [Ramlibacter henchirensis]TFZ02921.1 hypothetical protein EZ313_16945 [Ramlibacter henchirensis]
MITTGTRASGTAKRRPVQVDGGTFHKSEWMDSGQKPGVTPTVFLAEQPANYHLQSHFHRENQFQLFIDGAGSIGKRELGPVVVHYAGAFTGYGPIDSGPQGLKYFTIRSRFDMGMVPSTEARTRMPRGPKRHATSDALQRSTPEALAARTAMSEEVVIPAEAGMGARLNRMPLGSSYPVHHVDGSEGCFIFVINGTLEHEGRSYGQWEHFFLPQGETASMAAGKGGAEVLTLSIPPRADAYADAPTAVQLLATGEAVAN